MNSRKEKFFVEIDYEQCTEKGRAAGGEVYMQRRRMGLTTLVLSGGGGSGIRANVTANVVASMALSYSVNAEKPEHTARVIIDTFFGSGNEEEKQPTFTIVSISPRGEVYVMECGNPRFMLIRGGERAEVESKVMNILSRGIKYAVRRSRFKALPEDRMVFFTEGVATSGSGTRRMPEGWGAEGVAELCLRSVKDEPTISARGLAQRMLSTAQMNDFMSPRADMSCVSVYFRQPRKILISTGPPFNSNKDKILADMVATYDGTRVICGGTTAKIIARELGRELVAILKRDPSGLPPTYKMEGMDMVTEGVLTLSKVKSLLEGLQGTTVTSKGTDGALASLLLNHDIIEFAVGTCINPIHQDPSLPVELELRRNLIKNLAQVLEEKFMKEVRIQYI